MQIYCGTDIIEVARIQEAIDNTNGFKENVYTKNEIQDIERIKCQMKYQRYAGRFAAKEAIYKAMSKLLIENNINMGLLDVEIRNSDKLKGRPYVIFLNEDIASICKRYQIDIDVSISHIKETAISTVVVKQNIE